MYVALSTMDKWWFEGMDEEAGLKLLNKCIDEVQHRELHRHAAIVETPAPYLASADPQEW
jgi:hypothetical protein